MTQTFKEFICESTEKDVAEKIRKELKIKNIKAKVRISPGGGSVQVNAPAYGVHFSEEDQRQIKTIAKSSGLTLVRGLEINIDRMTNPETFEFYLSK